MKTRLTTWFALLVLCPWLFAQEPPDHRGRFFREGAVRALILSGYNNHDWRESTLFLKNLLLKSGAFEVRVIEEPAGLTSRTLSPYQVLILDYQGPRWGDQTEQAVTAFVSSGKGLVVVHGASYGFSGLDVLGDRHSRTGITEAPWPEYLRLAGGVWSDEDPKTAHGDRHSFEVRFVDRGHPVARGLPESFVATDELYHDLKMDSSVHVLATAYSDPTTRGTGEHEPVLWTLSHGKGRVFHTTLGHDLVAMAEVGFATTFVRGCEWAATGRVTLAPIDPLAQAAGAVRALVVTGGHSFDSEFYGLFDGDWLDWNHSTSNQEAFSTDLRDRYDVLVLYDMSRELDETGRKNLKDYLEAGRGLVVLHHALADYNSWPWWWREVVGGRYILEGGDDPPSSYQHDVELLVRTVGEHPVTSGLGPFHLVDETYKNMWISPNVTVLLETEETSSDRAVGWISPFETSRVVAIQPGHDRRAHLYPGYRLLVRRAILWSAGRL